MNNSNINKINKYKLKFLYSLIKKSSNNLGTYLKKYSQYYNLIQINTVINTKEDLKKSISNLLQSIFGKELYLDIINKSKINDNYNITFSELNFDTISMDIFKSIHYTNSKSLQIDSSTEYNEILEKINKIIVNTVKEIIPEQIKQKELSELKEPEESSELINSLKTDNFNKSVEYNIQSTNFNHKLNVDCHKTMLGCL